MLAMYIIAIDIRNPSIQPEGHIGTSPHESPDIGRGHSAKCELNMHYQIWYLCNSYSECVTVFMPISFHYVSNWT
jgi:hypothetical protein